MKGEDQRLFFIGVWIICQSRLTYLLVS